MTNKTKIKWLIIKLVITLIIASAIAIPTVIYRFKHPEKTETQIMLHTFKTIQWDFK